MNNKVAAGAGLMSYAAVLIICLSTVPLSGTATDIYSPSLPAIKAFFDINRMTAKLTMSIFVFGFGFGQIAAGVISEVYGRKWPQFFSLVLFAVASIIAAYAKHIEVLMLMRFTQGLLAAFPSVIGKAILSDTLTGRKLSHGFSYFIGAWALGPTIAPVIGGYLQQGFGWQANFYFLTVYSVILFLLVFFVQKETHINRMEFHFSRIKMRLGEILTHRAFFFCVIIMGFDYAFIVVFNMFAPFLIQTELHYDPVVYGHMALLACSAILIGSISNRFLRNKFKASSLVYASLWVEVVVSIMTMVVLHSTSMSLATIVIPTFIIIFASIIVHANLMTYCMSLFSHAGGIAAGTLGVTLFLLTAIISSIASLFHSTSQHPMAWFFTIMALLGLVFYQLFVRREFACQT